MYNTNNLRKNIIVSKNKTIQKRSIIGGGIPSSVTIPVSAYAVACLMHFFFVPLTVI
jgi:hypothetical protein